MVCFSLAFLHTHEYSVLPGPILNEKLLLSLKEGRIARKTSLYKISAVWRFSLSKIRFSRDTTSLAGRFSCVLKWVFLGDIGTQPYPSSGSPWLLLARAFPWSTLHLSGVSHQPGHGTQERQRNSGLDLPASRSLIPMPWHGDGWQIFSGLATNSVPNWESDRDTYRRLQFQIRAVLKSNECLKSDKRKKIWS